MAGDYKKLILKVRRQVGKLLQQYERTILIRGQGAGVRTDGPHCSSVSARSEGL